MLPWATEVYNVHVTRLTASEARRRFFHLLDAIERGEDVCIERKGVRFRVVLEESTHQEAQARPLIVHDSALLEGEWTWEPDETGDLRFGARRGDR